MSQPSFYIGVGICTFLGTVFLLYTQYKTHGVIVCITTLSIILQCISVVLIISTVGISLKFRTWNKHLGKKSNSEDCLSQIKSKKIKNIICKMNQWFLNYCSKDRYLCRFHKKSGTIITFFVGTKEQAQYYMQWYTDSEEKESTIIKNITPERATRIVRDDIEELEYQRISILQRLVVNPVIAFLRQPAPIWVSGTRLIFLFAILVIGTGFWTYVQSSLPLGDSNLYFTGQGSLKTAKYIIELSKNIFQLVLWIVLFKVAFSGGSRILKALKDYYSNIPKTRYSVGRLLFNLAAARIIINILLMPGLTYCIRIGQQYNYFLY